eukprot:CAMPEP_0201548950 /NCGR_PEP_ID=MMETSP0173_2-20130828/5437_1 /ASSEMBLY_ACC=CAM_ASM_000268 /TAXON_ID=218659 /ORGANISM="Vexillifera sp., Strain DIVA3 564/2" /LENGTH=364 /DNA_ID=CAMNT_0047958473 /DNA_START=991 /DNA_END=2085 /DNA_ORIENTATION=-
MMLFQQASALDRYDSGVFSAYVQVLESGQFVLDPRVEAMATSDSAICQDSPDFSIVSSHPQGQFALGDIVMCQDNVAYPLGGSIQEEFYFSQPGESCRSGFHLGTMFDATVVFDGRQVTDNLRFNVDTNNDEVSLGVFTDNEEFGVFFHVGEANSEDYSNLCILNNAKFQIVRSNLQNPFDDDVVTDACQAELGNSYRGATAAELSHHVTSYFDVSQFLNEDILQTPTFGSLSEQISGNWEGIRVTDTCGLHIPINAHIEPATATTGTSCGGSCTPQTPKAEFYNKVCPTMVADTPRLVGYFRGENSSTCYQNQGLSCDGCADINDGPEISTSDILFQGDQYVACIREPLQANSAYNVNPCSST